MSVCFSYTLCFFCSLKVFVFLVVALTSSCAFIAYFCLLPLGPPNVLSWLDDVAHLLWELDLGHDRLPLLQSYNHSSWIPSKGSALLDMPQSSSWCACSKSFMTWQFLFLSSHCFRWKMRSRLCRSVKSVSFLNQHEVITVASVKRKRHTVFSVPTGLSNLTGDSVSAALYNIIVRNSHVSSSLYLSLQMYSKNGSSLPYPF